MLILIALFTLLHSLLYISLFVGWNKIPVESRSKNQNQFSIIIPVRNEEHNIESLLRKLDNQSYHHSNFEVIVVDDFSEDRTAEKVKEWGSKAKLDLQLLQLADPNLQGKKHALTKGVEKAKYPIVVTTDADCSVGSEWISSYNDFFDEDTKMVAGPVGIVGKGMLAQFQQTEFAGLIGFGAVTISKNSPAMCSGANLGFRKSVFEEVNGYVDNLFTPSGDDEFMLHSVMKLYPESVKFLKDQRAVVETPAQQSWSELQNQRTRWTSKWKHNRNLKIQGFAILFFLDYLLIYTMCAGVIFGWVPYLFAAIIFLARFLADYLYLNRVNRFLGGKPVFFSTLFLQILYPAHVLLMGVSSIFGNYTWKGRRYR